MPPDQWNVWVLTSHDQLPAVADLSTRSSHSRESVAGGLRGALRAGVGGFCLGVMSISGEKGAVKSIPPVWGMSDDEKPPIVLAMRPLGYCLKNMKNNLHFRVAQVARRAIHCPVDVGLNEAQVGLLLRAMRGDTRFSQIPVAIVSARSLAYTLLHADRTHSA